MRGTTGRNSSLTTLTTSWLGFKPDPRYGILLSSKAGILSAVSESSSSRWGDSTLSREKMLALHLPGIELPQTNAEAVHIRLLIVGVVPDHFRSHPQRRAALRHGALVLKSGHTKVRHLHEISPASAHTTPQSRTAQMHSILSAYNLEHKIESKPHLCSPGAGNQNVERFKIAVNAADHSELIWHSSKPGA